MTTAFQPPFPDAELFDISEWPIVYARFPELGLPDRLARTMASLDAVADQAQRFVICWIPASHHHEDEPHEDERQSTMWLKRRKGDLRQHCAGYVYITTDPELRELLSGRFVQVEKLLPFPKLLAVDRDEARRKALGLLAAGG